MHGHIAKREDIPDRPQALLHYQPTQIFPTDFYCMTTHRKAGRVKYLFALAVVVQVPACKQPDTLNKELVHITCCKNLLLKILAGGDFHALALH